jgi:hypothetical protein
MTYVKAHARLMVDVRADGMMSEVHVHVHDRVCVCMCVCTGGVTVSFAQQVNLRVAMEGGNSCLRGTKRGMRPDEAIKWGEAIVTVSLRQSSGAGAGCRRDTNMCSACACFSTAALRACARACARACSVWRYA